MPRSSRTTCPRRSCLRPDRRRPRIATTSWLPRSTPSSTCATQRESPTRRSCGPSLDRPAARWEARDAMKVLVVEDEVKLAALIRKALREQGMLADVAIKGEDALWMAGASPYDVVVLDINLPGIDGFETVRQLRGRGVRTPILMLTARDGFEDRVEGLDTGADDYLVKPFDYGELFARIRALARRGPVERGTVVEVGDLTLDVSAHIARRRD